MEERWTRSGRTRSQAPERETPHTWYPYLAKKSAQASPMPELAPVIKMLFPYGRVATGDSFSLRSLYHAVNRSGSTIPCVNLLLLDALDDMGELFLYLLRRRCRHQTHHDDAECAENECR